MVSQTPADELFAAVRDGRLWRELDLAGVEDCLIAHDRHLRLVVAEGLHPEQQLIEDDAHAPNVNLSRREAVSQIACSKQQPC